MTYTIDKVTLTSIAAIAAKTFKLDAIKLLRLVDLITEDNNEIEFTLPESENLSKEKIEEMVDELIGKLEGLAPQERKNVFSVITNKMMADEDKVDDSDAKAKDTEVKKDESSEKQYVFTAYCYSIPVAVRSTATKVLDCYVKGHGDIRPSDLSKEEAEKILTYRSTLFSYDKCMAKKIFASLVDRTRGSLICDRWRADTI